MLYLNTSEVILAISPGLFLLFLPRVAGGVILSLAYSANEQR
jgi:hypothetical protein